MSTQDAEDAAVDAAGDAVQGVRADADPGAALLQLLHRAHLLPKMAAQGARPFLPWALDPRGGHGASAVHPRPLDLTQTWPLLLLLLLLLLFHRYGAMKALHFPLTVVVTHQVVKFVLAALCRRVWEAWTKRKRPVMAWRPYVVQMAPTGLAAALDIGLSNWSFEFVTISLYTMTKSTSVLFILGFALLFKLERMVRPFLFLAYPSQPNLT